MKKSTRATIDALDAEAFRHGFHRVDSIPKNGRGHYEVRYAHADGRTVRKTVTGTQSENGRHLKNAVTQLRHNILCQTTR